MPKKTEEQKPSKPQYDKDAVKAVTARFEELVKAAKADMATITKIKAKGDKVEDAKRFVKKLDEELNDLKAIKGADDKDEADYALGAVQRVLDMDVVFDDDVEPVFTALYNLGLKGKVAELTEDQTLSELIGDIQNDIEDITVE
jgi:hypothetical protein